MNCGRTSKTVVSNPADPWLGLSRAALAAACLAIAGCGLKGDLYLPEEPAPEESAQQSPTEEESAQEDPDSADSGSAGAETEQQAPGGE